MKRHKKIISSLIALLLTILAVAVVWAATGRRGGNMSDKHVADSLYAQAHEFLYAGNYSSAYNEVSKAFTLYSKAKDEIGMAKVNVRLAIIYYGMGQMELAQEHLDGAEPFLSQLPPEVCASFYRISAILKTEGVHDYPSAIDLMKKGIAADSLMQSEPSIYADIGNLAEIYINSREYDLANDCLQLMSDSSEAATEPMLAQKYLCLGRIAYEQGRNDSAAEYLGRSLGYAKSHDLLAIETGAMKMLTEIDSVRHDQDAYIRHFKTYVALKDSLSGSQITYRIACMQESSKIAQMEQEHRERQYRQNIVSMIVLSAILILALVLLFLYRRNKSMREIAELKSEQLEYKINLEQLQKELLELKVRKGRSQLDSVNKENLTMSLQLASYNKEEKANMESFDKSFMQMDDAFCQALTTLCPHLSSTDLRLACFIRLHMNANEMAKALNISSASLYKQRYRLRKKLGLNGEQSLEAYIASIAPRKAP